MAKYAVTNLLGGTQQAIGSSYKTLLSMFCGGTPRRIRLVELIIGCDGTPANNAITVDVSRMTADGTGTSVTPNPLTPSDAAALTASKANYTAEPTVTAASAMLNMAMNQQATLRWLADPDEDVIGPATATNGFVIRAKSASYTGTMVVTAIFEEL
jgi:hypothetical protein